MIDEMTPDELIWIKKVQANYFEIFGKKLIVDFPAMKGLVKPNAEFSALLEKYNKYGATKRYPFKSDTFLKSLLVKYNVTLEEIKNSRKFKGPKTELLIEFCKTCYNSAWDLNDCAEQIGKDRSTIYYYADIEFYKSRRILRNKLKANKN